MKLLFAGDVLLADNAFDTSFGISRRLSGKDRINYRNEIVPSNDIISRDYCLANLEFCISSNSPFSTKSKSLQHRVSPDLIGSIEELPVDIFSVANNHIMQHGIIAFNDTIKYLRENNKKIIGIRDNPYTVVKKEDKRIGIIGVSMAYDAFAEKECGYYYCYPITQIDEPTFKLLQSELHGNGMDIEQYYHKEGSNYIPLIKKIRKSKEDELSIMEAYVSLLKKGVIEDSILEFAEELHDIADNIVLYIHWGEEYTHYVAKWQKEYSDFLISRGIKYIIGCHPHAIQPCVVNKDEIIAYSLGNTFFNTSFPMAKQGLLIGLTFEKDEVNTEYYIWEYNEKQMSSSLLSHTSASKIIKESIIDNRQANSEMEPDEFINSVREGTTLSRKYKKEYMIKNLDKVNKGILVEMFVDYLKRVCKRGKHE